MHKQQTSLLQGSIWKGMTAFAVPILLGQIFQQLYNTADAWIVGRFRSNSEDAAVTSTGSLVFLVVGFFSGIAVGAVAAVAGLVLAKSTGIYEIVPGFIAGLLATWLASTLSKEGPGAQVEAMFDTASKAEV